MNFERDYRLSTEAIVATAHLSVGAAQVFNILNNPSSWGQTRLPRVASAIFPSKVVLSFGRMERATVGISPWSSDFCEIDVVLDGFSDATARAELETYWVAVLEMLRSRIGQESFVLASSPSKVNVYFAVGSFLKDGFHEVASCYQALSLREKVKVELTSRFSINIAGPMGEQSKGLVPTDTSNLVYKAGLELQQLGSELGPDLVAFTIHKSVPVAGGMAGGSADGAAALIAMHALFDLKVENQLPEAAAKLGSDVPFSLVGGTAVGLGRGEKLSKLDTEAVLHWVVTPSAVGLSTPNVYRQLDVMRVEAGVDVTKLKQPTVPDELLEALTSGNPYEVAKYMHNDLEIAALALRPELAEIIDAGKKAEALRSMVSGSGPTIAHLAKSRLHAEQIVNRLGIAGFPSVATHTSATGTRLEN